VHEPTYDTLVVGGRLAGASTALLLARAGRRVLVLERGRYGSDTLSTHALMRGGVVQLSRWGLMDALRAAGTPPVHRTVVRYGELEEVIGIRPSAHVDALYAPRRTVLDRVVVDAAVRAGATFRFGVSVDGLVRSDDGRVVGVVGRDRDGRFTARAPITVGADGTRSTVARLVGAPVLTRGRHATAMVAGRWRDVAADGYQWLYGEACGGGIIPTNDGEVCVWAGVPAARFDDLRRDPADGLRGTMAHLAPDWADALARGTRIGPLRGFAGIPGYVRASAGPGWALVGDAAHFKDPITAHGMTDAMRDAELLTRALLTVPAGSAGPHVDHAVDGYVGVRDALSCDLLHAADRVASFAWSLADLRRLLLEMSRAMRDEVAYLTALDEPVAA
jgi:flavin-dependent dehydrogenase